MFEFKVIIGHLNYYMGLSYSDAVLLVEGIQCDDRSSELVPIAGTKSLKHLDVS